MVDSLYFLLRFLRHPARIASLVPSSRALTRALFRGLDLEDDDLVIEYGPGTGAFTSEIARIRRSGRTIRYLGIERDPGMCRHLAGRFPDLDFVCDDVRNVEAIHAERELGPARAIISGVPLIFMNGPDLGQVLTATRGCLTPDGEFRTISYVHSYPFRGARRLREYLEREFADFSRHQLEWRNLPPAFVLAGRLQPSQFAVPEAPAAFVIQPSTCTGTIEDRSIISTGG